MKKRSLLTSLALITSIWNIYTAQAASASRIRAAARWAVNMFYSKKATTTGALMGAGAEMLSGQSKQQEHQKVPKRWIPILFPDGNRFSPMGPAGLLPEEYPRAIVCITPSKLGGAARITTFEHVANDVQLAGFQKMLGKHPLEKRECWLRLRDEKTVPSIVHQNKYWQGLTPHNSRLVASVTYDSSTQFQLFAQKFTQDASRQAIERARKLKDVYTETRLYPTNVFMREDVDLAKLQAYGLFVRCNRKKTVCVAGTVE